MAFVIYVVIYYNYLTDYLVGPKPSQFNILPILSRSTLGSLISFLLSLCICMIILTLSFTPFSVNVEPSDISWVENITDNEHAQSIESHIGNRPKNIFSKTFNTLDDG
jgi:hypothetical protein